MRRSTFTACGCAVLALGVTACGEGGGGSGGGGGTTAEGTNLTVYSSLPLQGASREQNVAVNNGAKLALEAKNGKVGKYSVKFTQLDDSTAQAGTWDAGQVSQNARKAVQDKTSIGYIGEFNSGASAISMPILNEAPLPQISPANTAVGLTSKEAGADKGEPEKYYPTQKRHYARIVPKDTVQGAALATLMKSDGCTKVAILNDKEVYGAGLASNVESAGQKQGLEVTSNEGIDPKAPNYRSVATEIQSQGADCFVFSGITANNGAQVFKDVAAAVPEAKLYGPDGVAEKSFAKELPSDVAAKTKVTVATLSPEEYPPEGQAFFGDYEKKYGEKNPDPYAIYGYEAMNLLLDAIERAGDKGNDRQAVIDQLLSTKGRKSVLGTYDIDQNGDTSLTDYGVYTVTGKEVNFEKTIKAEGV